MDILNSYIEKNGGQAEFARRVDCSRGLVNHWCTGRRIPTPEMCRRIEVATKGEIKRVDLLPELFGDVA